ncbi:Ca2+/Na+ antiporter [Virgibacillus natechei]|uniref:Ca2+/Na+ antiporter n=1 Tax=Virgibacillus natechei TaxID=1216297 RepID=A0ABS4IBN4_9BACI|nr:hypothetical protein [Virgibacillus natechei]MBP1968344.1 Ca2+/Na+ antiporter [Virgibacillus natechei]UZD13477.1 hypothetical protein OLD84_02640 [Virgibacillus natechei]
MVSGRFFYSFGILLFLIFSVMLVISLMTSTLSLVETLPWGGMTYMCFAIGYLQPQVSQKDERTKYIKQKAMQYSLTAIIGFTLVLTIVLQTNLFTLTSTEVLSLLTGFSMITIFSIFIIVAKRN